VVERARFNPLARLALAIADPAVGSADGVLPLPRAVAEALTAADGPTVAEAILQGIPYSGFPGAVEALGLLRDRDPSPPHESVAPESVVPETSDPPAAFRAVYRDGTDAVRAALRARHPDLERWILSFAYGTVMGRGILGLDALEGLAVASLLGQRRRAPLHSHLRGALRNGWSEKELRDLVDDLAPLADPGTVAFAHAIIAREG